MTHRYFIKIRYKGTHYHGWQLQPGEETIQKHIDNALSVILREKIGTTGAGRTDAGVHAREFYAHFNTSRELITTDNWIVYKLNCFLPEDISVIAVRKVKDDAHARFSAISRTYKYYISSNKDPFMKEFSWHIPGEQDLNKMNEAAKLLLKHTIFTSFSKLHSDNKTDICKITHAKWEQSDDMLVFTITADRFLRNMVRAIVGTMADVGRGKTDISEFEEIITSRDRGKAGKSAPARGLFLTAIEYPEDIYI